MGGGLPDGAQDDQAIAQEIASDVCTADLLEFQRLTEQLEGIKQWLLDGMPEDQFHQPLPTSPTSLARPPPYAASPPSSPTSPTLPMLLGAPAAPAALASTVYYPPVPYL